MTEVAVVTPFAARLGESPVWSVAEQALWFVDIKGRAIHRFDPADGSSARIETPEDVGCVALAADGSLVAAMRTRVVRLARDGTILETLARNPEDPAASRFNDGRVDPAGRLLVGTIDESRRGTARLYRLDRRGLAPLLDGLLTSNGLAFAPDGRTVHHADTPRRRVTRHPYDPATGEIGAGAPFATFDASQGDLGRPDGGAFDVEGCYWTALYEGGRIRRYAPDGTLLREIEVPARCPTMPAFGGPDLRTLFVTSASDGRPEEELAELPLSGRVFAIRVDVPGLPEPLFDRDVG